MDKTFTFKLYNNRSGVTIMELLLVVALIAIVSAIAMPTVYHNFTRESEQYMVDSVLVEVEYARSMGLMDLPAYATFKTAAGSGAFEVATQTKRLDGSVVFVESQEFGFSNLGKLLDADGTDSAAAKTLTVKAGSKNIGAVQITPAGLIRRAP